MRSVLVTGGAGFIGRHTCARLEDGGYQPIVFDRRRVSRLKGCCGIRRGERWKHYREHEVCLTA